MIKKVYLYIIKKKMYKSFEILSTKFYEIFGKRPFKIYKSKVENQLKHIGTCLHLIVLDDLKFNLAFT